MPELMAGAIKDCMAGSDKPILAYVSPHAPDVAALLTQRGVPAFSAAESCAVALAGMLQLSRWKEPAAGSQVGAAVSIADFPSGSLDEAQAKALFSRFGIPVAREQIVSTMQEAELAAKQLGARVVLKILSAEITHKSDVGGVAVSVPAEQIGQRLTEMTAEVQSRAGVPPQRFLVQEMVTGGTEVILGMHRDPLGTAILLGMGGVLAELFKDTTMRLLPSQGCLSREEALAMARELKTWPLLDGFRGRPKADVEALVSAIVAFSNMSAQIGERLMEAEINPLFVLAEGQGVCAADGVVVLG
jgi:acyl-CoA synthetase (NDP forming)